MNLAGMTSLLVVIIGSASSAAAAASVGAPWWLSVLCGIAGLGLGFVIALPISKVAYKLLELNSPVGFAAYLILPLFALIGSGGIVFSGTFFILSWFGYAADSKSIAETPQLRWQNTTLVERADGASCSLLSGEFDPALPQP
jgi:hypothetical protein